MTQVKAKTTNGVNVEQLIGTIEAVKSDPDVALFKFKSNTEWINGGHCKTKIKDFYGAKQDVSRENPFIVEGDEPGVLLGENKAPNAVEAVLHALASCLSVGVVYNASAKGITINSLSFELEGEIDLHNFLGLSEEKRAGYSNISVRVNADTSATKDQFMELMEYVKKTSPVMDIVQNPVPVHVTVA